MFTAIPSQLVAHTFQDKIRALCHSKEHLVGIGDANLEVFDLNRNEFIKIKNEQLALGSIYSLQYINNSNIILIGRHDGSIQLFDVNSLKYLSTFKNHSNTVKCFTMSIENEHVFYSGSYDGTIQMWDDRKLQTSLKTSPKHSGYVNSLTFYNNQIYSTSIDGISIFDSTHLKLISKSKQKSEILSSCHLPSSENSSNLYFSSKDGSVKIFDMNCNQVIFTLNEIDQISVNAMDCNETRLYSCNNQGQVKEFDLENLYEIQQFETKSKNDLKNMDSSIRSCCLCENLLLLGVQSRKIKVLQL